jgi:hypothetical protein
VGEIKMNKAFAKAVTRSQHRNVHALSARICSLAIGLSVMSGCASDENEDVSLPPNQPASSVKRPKLGSVKVKEPTVAELQAQIAKIKSDPNLDEGKRGMALGMMEGKLKEIKSRNKQ